MFPGNDIHVSDGEVFEFEASSIEELNGLIHTTNIGKGWTKCYLNTRYNHFPLYAVLSALPEVHS